MLNHSNQPVSKENAMTNRKTMTFAIVHMSVAFGVVYLMTGSLALGGAVALVEPLINTMAYFFHEKVWDRFTVSRQAIQS